MICVTGIGLTGSATAVAGRIAFSSNRDGDREIYAMDADGSNVVQLTGNSADDDSRSWSPAAGQTVILLDPSLSQTFTLAQNHPNPFNPETTIRYHLPRSEEIALAVYNLAGQPVAALASGFREGGRYSLRWNGRDDAGRELVSGVYLYRLVAGDRKETRKLLLPEWGSAGSCGRHVGEAPSRSGSRPPGCRPMVGSVRTCGDEQDGAGSAEKKGLQPSSGRILAPGRPPPPMGSGRSHGSRLDAGGRYRLQFGR